jgi:hypothetical protein
MAAGTAGPCAALLLAAALVGATASAAELGASEGDGSLSREEFRAGMGAVGLYELWDTDRDGLLSDEEYRAQPPEHFTAAQAAAWNDGGPGLDRAQFEGRFYDAYDLDDDHTLAEREFGLFLDDGARQGWFE